MASILDTDTPIRPGYVMLHGTIGPFYADLIDSPQPGVAPTARMSAATVREMAAASILSVLRRVPAQMRVSEHGAFNPTYQGLLDNVRGPAYAIRFDDVDAIVTRVGLDRSQSTTLIHPDPDGSYTFTPGVLDLTETGLLPAEHPNPTRSRAPQQAEAAEPNPVDDFETAYWVLRGDLLRADIVLRRNRWPQWFGNPLDNLAAVADAYQAAERHRSYADEPEWLDLTQVMDAAREFGLEMGEQVRVHGHRLTRDSRFQEAMRSAALGAARRVAALAGELAERLDADAHPDEPGRGALRALERVARKVVARLDPRTAVIQVADLIAQQAQVPIMAHPELQSVAAAVRAAEINRGEYNNSPAYTEINSLWRSVETALGRAHQQVADRRGPVIGFDDAWNAMTRTLAVEACNKVGRLAHEMATRLGAADHLDTPGYDAMRELAYQAGRAAGALAGQDAVDLEASTDQVTPVIDAMRVRLASFGLDGYGAMDAATGFLPFGESAVPVARPASMPGTQTPAAVPAFGHAAATGYVR